jgi:maltose alpha-D-glucosyltransferase / alpha-amylase
LMSKAESPDFAPEAFSPQYQRSLYQSTRKLVSDVFYRLKYALPTLTDEWRAKAESLLAAESELHARFTKVLQIPMRSYRIRCHGDCDLAQILYLGNDFVFIDFEGSPLQTLGERRIKRSPIRDVVSMMRSFDYVAICSLYGLMSGRGRPVGLVRKEDFPLLDAWIRRWSKLVKTTFAESYREHAQSLPIGRYTQAEWDTLLDTFSLEKMLIELIYELEYRPAWLFIPLAGLCEVLTCGNKSEVAAESTEPVLTEASR